MKKIKFNIERLDRFAQGVHFGDKTTFVERAPENIVRAEMEKKAQAEDKL